MMDAPEDHTNDEVTPRAGQHRSDFSQISIDSFVFAQEELRPKPGEMDQQDKPDYSLDYMSPESSTTVSEHSKQSGASVTAVALTSSQQPLSRLSFRSDEGRTVDSLSIPDHIEPAHQFFSPLMHEEAYGSDGSFVLNPSNTEIRAVSPQTLQEQQRKASIATMSADFLSAARATSRERLPSFESVGSSSSIRILQPTSSASTKRAGPQAQPSIQQRPLPLLPYHERRKLLAKRSKDERGRDTVDVSTVAVRAVDDPEFGNDRQVSSHHDQSVPLHFVPYNQYPLPHDALPLPSQQIGPQAMYPSTPAFYAHQSLPSRHGQAHDFSKSMDHSRPMGPQQPQPMSSVNPRQQYMVHTSSQQHSYKHSQNSSIDSTEGRFHHREARQQHQPPPPPPLLVPSPPPPPPRHVSHAHRDSAGSISSLGSLDRSGHDHVFYGQQPHTSYFEPDHDQQNVQTGLYQQHTNYWGPPQQSQRLTIALPHQTQQGYGHFEYRRNSNQAFLHSIQQQGQHHASPIVHYFQRKVLHDDSIPIENGPKRIDSLENGMEWEERILPAGLYWQRHHQKVGLDPVSSGRVRSDESMSSSDSLLTDDEAELDRDSHNDTEPHEQTRLLPPTGISTNEYYDIALQNQRSSHRHRHRPSRNRSSRHGAGHIGIDLQTGENDGVTFDDQNVSSAAVGGSRETDRKRRRKKRKNRSHKTRDAIPSSVSSVSSDEYQLWLVEKKKLLEDERVRLVKQWRAEARAEEEASRMRSIQNNWRLRLGRKIQSEAGMLAEWLVGLLTRVHSLVANMPSSVGAISLSIAFLGIDWFKYAEERLPSCEPVHFHSTQCTFPEFPGCYYCDITNRAYQLALYFHWICSAIAGLLACLFVMKLLVARQVVLDELSSPITAAPAGLVCMTLCVVFAGRGPIGMVVVYLASSAHFCLALWFIYIAVVYKSMPDPSWFPNTTGIGICAVKTWLYWPSAGQFLMAFSLALSFVLFPLSILRVILNRKISSTVCWMQMGAPNVVLYALTIMAQPSFSEEQPDLNPASRIERTMYLPTLHVLFAVSCVGVVVSVLSLFIRRNEFKSTKFSPAHSAFLFPTLSHANSLQAYRSAINSFSTLPTGNLYRVFLYYYWIFYLVIGTMLTVAIASKFLFLLPSWTFFVTSDEEEPPSPLATEIARSTAFDYMERFANPFISTTVLNAHEAGLLVFTHDEDGEPTIRRTRRVYALGFEPIMDQLKFAQEKSLLLEAAAQLPLLRRNRTLTVPGVYFNYGYAANWPAKELSGDTIDKAYSEEKNQKAKSEEKNYMEKARGYHQPTSSSQHPSLV